MLSNNLVHVVPTIGRKSRPFCLSFILLRQLGKFACFMQHIVSNSMTLSFFFFSACMDYSTSQSYLDRGQLRAEWRFASQVPALTPRKSQSYITLHLLLFHLQFSKQNSVILQANQRSIVGKQVLCSQQKNRCIQDQLAFDHKIGRGHHKIARGKIV